MKAASPSQAQRVLILPPHKSCHWNQWVPDQRESLPVGSVDLDMGDWSMGCRELTELMEALGREGFTVQQIITHCPKTQIGAAALGFPTGLRPMADTDEETALTGKKIVLSPSFRFFVILMLELRALISDFPSIFLEGANRKSRQKRASDP